MSLIELQNIPFFQHLTTDLQDTIREMAEERRVPAGETLFAEGDAADVLYLHASGKLMLSRDAVPIGEAHSGDLLDLIPALGALPHTLRAIALTDCTLLCWRVVDLLHLPEVDAAARGYLASALLDTQARADALAAPIHFNGDTAQLPPGPFVFNNTTLVMAFCDADLDSVRARLPEGVSLFRPAWRKRDSLFLAMAEFRDAYPEHNPDARFSYTETTYFIPVRCGRQFGLFPAYIYPSTYEPILLGREIYGFPKRLGHTQFIEETVGAQRAAPLHHTIHLTIDGAPSFTFTYAQTETASEPRLIRALSDWLGVQGRVTEAAFRVGDAMLETMQIGLQRRISVYNHKRIPAATTRHSDPAYSVDELTQAVFTVMKWHHILHLPDAALTITGEPLRYADVTLREAYATRLDMRLSTGRVVRGYMLPL